MLGRSHRFLVFRGVSSGYSYLVSGGFLGGRRGWSGFRWGRCGIRGGAAV
jgi:hypothetical protein